MPLLRPTLGPEFLPAVRWYRAYREVVAADCLNTSGKAFNRFAVTNGAGSRRTGASAHIEHLRADVAQRVRAIC
jgi:hypothetical protein